MVCKLAQIPPEIWMDLPLEAKKWLLEELKRQQREDDKLKSHPIQAILKILPSCQEKIMLIQALIPICPINMQRFIKMQ
jgi:hypothetical protein